MSLEKKEKKTLSQQNILEIKNDSILFIDQPTELKVNLYKHQLASIYQMEKKENNKKIINNSIITETELGINADKLGSGKTLSMIGLILRDKMSWDINVPFVYTITQNKARGKIKQTKLEYYDKINTSLILADTSIIHQWEEEIGKSNLKSVVIKNRKILREQKDKIETYDIVLVTPYMYNFLLSKFSKKAWKRFIFDEPGQLRISGMKNIICGFTWLVCATPKDIIRKHQNCKSSFMFDIVHDCYLRNIFHETTFFGQENISFWDGLIVKNSEEFIKKSFSLPKITNFYYYCWSPLYFTLNGFINSNLSEMIAADNIEEAVKLLGGTNTDNITELIKKKKEEKLKKLIKKLNKEEKKLPPSGQDRDTAPLGQARGAIQVGGTAPLTQSGVINKDKKILNIKNKILKSRQEIKEIEKRYQFILEQNCSICLDKLKNPIMESNCQNIFCGSCIFKWLEQSQTCPLCRDKIDSKNLIYISKKKNISTEKINKINKLKTPKTKLDTILNLIKSNPRGRFIIFSSWSSTFYKIRNLFKKNNIEFIELKGHIKNKENNIKNFKNGKSRVIFLNSSNNGCGINLQEATDIIIYHEMSQNLLNQVVARANRIGRKDSLNVHYLLNKIIKI